MWEPPDQVTPIEWWFDLPKSEQIGGREDLNMVSGEAFNITNDVSFHLKWELPNSDP
jgi:hypothetical protein